VTTDTETNVRDRWIDLPGRMLFLAIGCLTYTACSRVEPPDRNTHLAQGSSPLPNNTASESSAARIADSLRSPDKNAAVRALEKLKCPLVDTATLSEVQQAWLDRQQPSATVDDDLVRTLLAKCIIEANQTRDIPVSIRSSAAAQLRISLESPEIRVAATGLPGYESHSHD
jgi:hypothetical protein